MKILKSSEMLPKGLAIALGAFDGILCLATIMHVNIQNMHKTFENMNNTKQKGLSKKR